MMQEQWLTRLLVICAMCSEATEKLKVPYDFAAYPSYKSYYKLRQNDKFLYKNPKVRIVIPKQHLNQIVKWSSKPQNELGNL